ncbi:hypothetical protein [Gemmiger formicilis]|uniref:hypothetical protein n=1 Tax=Gemmiger formicilis TaxID=745368 RepID=UPI00351FA2F0
MPGWCAHRGVEEVEFANRIIRPAYKYPRQAARVRSAGEAIRSVFSRCKCAPGFFVGNGAQ